MSRLILVGGPRSSETGCGCDGAAVPRRFDVRGGRPSKPYAAIPAPHSTVGTNSSHLKSESMAKFVQLMVATVAKPTMQSATPVRVLRSATADTARNAVSTPDAAMNPPMTMKTRCNQRSRPWDGTRSSPTLPPMYRRSSGRSGGRTSAKYNPSTTSQRPHVKKMITDARGRVLRARVRIYAAASPQGSHSTNTLPCPLSLRTVIAPPSASTMRALMASPIPTPGPAVGSSRTNS